MKPKDAKTYTASDWLPFYALAGLGKKELAEAKSNTTKAIHVGQFLSPNVGREVPIQVGERTGRARLVRRKGRSNATHYFFAVVWDEAEPAAEATEGDRPPASEIKGARPKAKPADAVPSGRTAGAGKPPPQPPRPKRHPKAPAKGSGPAANHAPGKRASPTTVGGNDEVW